MEKIPVRISKDEADEQQAHSMIPKTERYTDTPKQALTRKRQKVKHDAYGRKGRERKRLYINACGKERKNRPQMPVAKKERTDHKCLWQRKKYQTTNACGKRKMAALIYATKSQQSNRLLSATKEWTIIQSYEHRAKITVPTTNRWKAKLTTTNSKLAPH